VVDPDVYTFAGGHGGGEPWLAVELAYQRAGIIKESDSGHDDAGENRLPGKPERISGILNREWHGHGRAGGDLSGRS
jgi:hypothetical protein